jgi:Flp pilus assembly protein TadD
VEAWKTRARLQQKRGKERDALECLLEGAAQFRSRRHWPQAIHLLRRANEISPWDFDAVLALCRLLAKSGQLEEARRLLEGLGARSEGDRLRHIHGALFRLDGDLRHAWNWLRCAVKPEAEKSYG